MRVFAIAAMGAVLMAGCAPFQHGHYTEDVAYLNSKGDPPGTPLVYQEDNSNRATFNPTAYAAIQSPQTHSHHTTTVASNAFGAGGFPTTSVSQPVQYSQPVSYSAPAPTYTVQQAAVPAPTYSTPVSYQAPVQQVYSAPVVQTYARPVQQTYAKPIQQIYTPPVQQRLTRASYVAPTVQSTSPVLATSYGGGHKFDADGYAICDIPFPDHAAHQIPKFTPSYQPASSVQRTRPQTLRF